MKKTIILICSVIILLDNLKAQDTIIKFNGDTVLAKITEIAQGQIRYKRTNFQDGPSYLEMKSDIAMIRYSTGLRETFAVAEPAPVQEYYKEAPSREKIVIRGASYKQDGIRLTEKNVHEILRNTKDPEIIRLVAGAKRSKGLQNIGFAAIPLGIAGIICVSEAAYVGGSKNAAPVFSLGGICIASAIASPIVSGMFKHKRHKSLNSAVKIYNQKY